MTPLHNDIEPIEDPEKEIQELEAEHAKLAEEQKQEQQQARDLLEKEVRGEGVFARQIYDHKQHCIVLATQMQHIRAKINRIKLGLGTL